MISEKDIKNESDVEQKFILPLLTNSQPVGLGYSSCDFRTKPDIRQLEIDKGRAKKLYYPDYIVILHGLPVLVIEAKHPEDNNLEEAIREARLYAGEINSLFPSHFNPCQKLIATNSLRTICGSWDDSSILLEISNTEIDASHPNLAKLITFGCKVNLEKFSDVEQKKLRGNVQFKRPTNIIGGRSVRNEEVKLNSFGNTLALEYRHLFNPESEEERKNIVKKAYVKSTRRLRHVDPIDKIIRAANPPSITDAHQISTTDPSELLRTLTPNDKLHHQLLVLIGGVGSGKSTFIDYLREVSLPEEIKESTVWISINMNLAPLSRGVIYSWLENEIINEFRNHNADIDFDSLPFLEKLYSVELNKIKKGAGAYFDEYSDKYKSLLADELIRVQGDTDATMNACIRHFCAERQKLLIVSLDNSDKRNRDDQLLMFDVAKWLQKTCRCLVFLPIRDTTYDHHRTEPPLDTVIKDLVFRIDAPLFMDVLYKRVKLALAEMDTEKENSLSYVLPNGFRVEYPQSEQAYYLACILRSLFQNDALFRRIVSGIAGSNIRKGLEIFLDFCKSGHIHEDQIFKIRHAKGDYVLPKHIVTRVLFRGNRRYYNDANSLVKNIFASFPEDIIPDPFARLSVLSWLKKKYRTKGPSGMLGYHKTATIINELVAYGHDERRLSDEISELIKAGCISTESQNINQFSIDDLISIAPSGHVHLDLLINLDYLSTCSEDVWFKDARIAEDIADRLIGSKGKGHMSYSSSVDNASVLLSYLEEYKDSYLANPEAILAEERIHDFCNITEPKEYVQKLKEKASSTSDTETLQKKYPPGRVVDCQVTGIKKYGLFVEFGIEGTGLIHISEFNKLKDAGALLLEEFDAGDQLRAEIVCYKHDHGRFNLKPAHDTNES
ncbi:ribosomal protein S1 (plasmid) [Desulfocapsa sulfexigens DSM 10523]|uniref:Ribosomal protein S1 n=1 Tax=Desulfocapsa sulfexigens (strain DSM 10523 / SB164P1) TaxID=1167006 RepID=M1NKI4_DESSD|nr:type I restriction endonuclease [Desulfocapsa sulfexigens]AGF80099.1 ribosomal protein S1 [Desulfocapsa sulfexigens DSM 10523]